MSDPSKESSEINEGKDRNQQGITVQIKISLNIFFQNRWFHFPVLLCLGRDASDSQDVTGFIVLNADPIIQCSWCTDFLSIF